jgi:hypothetical protein
MGREITETEQLLQTILRGAFAGPPTPLKDIPKRDGEVRAKRNQRRARRRRQRKNRAA